MNHLNKIDMGGILAFAVAFVIVKVLDDSSDNKPPKSR